MALDDAKLVNLHKDAKGVGKMGTIEVLIYREMTGKRGKGDHKAVELATDWGDQNPLFRALCWRPRSWMVKTTHLPYSLSSTDLEVNIF